ncbi:MAG: Amuc_1100 family pilus-like protein [Kiritimatiellae bacterium]|nr:Amuc_1100 family pilus-like protein [Kiritimatiellia bacterium]
MNLKKNMTLIVGGAIAGVLLVILLVLLFRFNSSYQKVNRELQSAQQRLTILNGRDPFPSEENVAVVRTNLAVLQDFFGTLMKSLQEGQPEIAEMEPAEFNLLLDQTRRRLFGAAAKVKVALPPGFSFGFDRYAAGTLPDAVDVPRLVAQMKEVEFLCGLLYASKIGEISSIERAVFEASARPTVATETFVDPRMARYGGGAPAATAAATADTYKDASGLFSRQRYTVTFRGRDAAVEDFLNRVASSKRFLVVTRLQLENETGVPKVTAPLPATAAPGTAPAAPLAREKRVSAGREPVKVIVEVEVYRFHSPQDGEASS